MVDFGTIYVVATGAALLLALGVGLRVLVGIFRDGRERSRKRRAGEVDRHTGDPVYDRDPADTDAGGGAWRTCPQCGAENASEFAYCCECAAPLGPNR